MLEILFWLSLSLIFYSYALYPVVLMFMSAITQLTRDARFVLNRSDARVASGDLDWPEVAVIISAYNEESVIEQRISNLKALDYPPEKISFLIGSDGSKDGTDTILLQHEHDSRFQIHIFKENRGKASVLNDLVDFAEAEILVFSDANTHFEVDAVKKLVRHYAFDVNVDAVCGELHLYDPGSGNNQDNLYWQYERVLKFHESRIGGLLGANGAIYALRKSKYVQLQSDTVIDDFTTVFTVSTMGGKAIYDPEAKALEEIAPDSDSEYRRRIRIGSGNYQAFRRFLSSCLPIKPVLWLCYFSHKVLRWHTPHLLLVSLLSSAVLAVNSTFYSLLFLGQILIYTFSYVYRNTNLSSGFLRLIVFWVNMNIALGQGAIKYYRGGLSGQWSSTQR